MRSQALHIYCSVADDTSIELVVRRTVLQLQLINLILQHNCFLAPTDFPLSGKNIINIYIFSGVSVVLGLSSALTPSNFSRCKGTTFPTPRFPKRHETA